jgi:diguanylate cyclase (GGDEF)-like protein
MFDFNLIRRWRRAEERSESIPPTGQPSISAPARPRPVRPRRRDGQGVRLFRHLLGALASLTVVAVLYLYAASGFVTYDVAHVFTLLVIVCVSTFTVCIVSGFNRRFADPSLTVGQMAAAGLALAYLAFASGPFRGRQLPFYMIALLFGAFRLTTRQQLAISAYFVASFASAVAWAGGLSFDFRRSAGGPLTDGSVLILHLALVLLLMSVIGGYVNNYRVRLRATNDALKQALEKIERIATYDELTGLYSRRVISDIAAKELKRSDRRGFGVCVAIVDADHFKRFNDLYGHAGGDRVLRMLGSTLRRSLRETEHVGRYGGEEFMIVLPETTMESAVTPLERLRREIGATPIDGLPAQERVTVSIGVADYQRGEDLGATIERADAALYEAKHSGRDRLVRGAH